MRGWEAWIFLGTSFHGQGIRVALGVECDEDAAVVRTSCIAVERWRWSERLRCDGRTCGSWRCHMDVILNMVSKSG